MFALACTPNNLDGIPQNFLSCKFSKTLLIGYIIAIIDVLSSMFSDLTKFQKWAKGISIFLLINKVFKTSNWRQLLLWPMAIAHIYFYKDFLHNIKSMTKGKQTVQNFKLEAASLMANGQRFLRNINDKGKTFLSRDAL